MKTIYGSEIFLLSLFKQLSGFEEINDGNVAKHQESIYSEVYGPGIAIENGWNKIEAKRQTRIAK